MEIFLINLDRRPDRLQTASDQLKKFQMDFTRVPAVDGSAVPLPDGWTSAGAYGCSLSHRKVLKDCIDRGVKEVMVLEDDIVLSPTFDVELLDLIHRVKDLKWDAIFLGGQHTVHPREVKPGLVRCQSTHRTHAYIIRGDYMRYVHDLWVNYKGHIDHEWGRHQEKWNVYAPSKWLVGQGDGKSDINGRQYGTRWWTTHNILPAIFTTEGKPIEKPYPRKYHRQPIDQKPYPRKTHEGAIRKGYQGHPIAERRTFYHAGDLGDLIYSLPCLRKLCCDVPSQLVLYGSTIVRESWTAEKVDKVKPFLDQQPYLASVRYEESLPKDHNGIVMDDWRNHFKRRMNLADMICLWGNVPRWDATKSWCMVDQPERIANVVIARSPRYHTMPFPWRAIVQKYGKQSVFVGTEDEHKAFNAASGGDIPYHPTPTLLDLARVLSGADLVIANQSAPRALAESLKRPIWVEEYLKVPDTHFDRRWTWYQPSDLGRVGVVVKDKL